MKCGLVLSGGAAWGIANIGIVEVLDRHGFRFDCIAGSSMGAIVAGAYAFGIPMDILTSVARQMSMLRIAKLTHKPFADGLHSGALRQQFEDMLFPLLGNAAIGDCHIPFVCVAAKVKKPIDWWRIFSPGFTDHFFHAVEPYVFPPETRMIDALLASSAIPVVFAPVRIGSDEFVDLIHFGAIPARTLRSVHRPDIVIGTDTHPQYGILRRFLPSPWQEFMARGQSELTFDRQACDFVITPRMPAAVFRFDRAADFIAAGRRAAEKSLPELTALLSGDA